MNRSKMDLFESVDRFVMAAASDEPAAELGADFERMLQESEDACDLYIDCVQMSLLLPSLLAGEPEEQLGPDDAVLLGQARSLSPYTGLAFLGNAVQGTVGYFSSGWPVAYLAATVILGMGLLIGALIPVSEPAQVARQSPLPSRVDAEPKMEFVGRITGMVDCNWSRVQSPESSQSDSRLSTLDSRLPWATIRPRLRPDGNHVRHRSQGHFARTDDLRSRVQDGGYLSVGKLTARLEKRAEKSTNRIQSPTLIPHYPRTTIHYSRSRLPPPP